MTHRFLLLLLLNFCCVGCSRADEHMDDAVLSGDHGEVLREFHAATYNRCTSLEPTRLALQSYLEHSDPVVRFYAAQYLYVLGDNSGYQALIALMNMSDKIDAHGKDVRLRAIELLDKYREKRAVEEIARFFYKTKAIDAFNALLRLGRGEAPVEPLTAYPDAHPYPSTTVFSLSLRDPHSASKLAATTFNDPKCPDIYASQSRQIAAWAMLRAGADEPYFSYLHDRASKAIAGVRPNGSDTNEYRKALEYLASVLDPRVEELLEDALQSEDQRVVQVALVNLIYNQHNTEAARQRLIAEFDDRLINLGSEFTLQLAAAWNDPDVSEAGERFSVRDSTQSWRQWSVVRKGWPIYNWIDDYVIILTTNREQGAAD